MPFRAGILIPLLCCLGLGLVSAAPGGAVVPVSPPVDAQLAGQELDRFTFKAGTAFQILLQTPIDTAVNQAGDPVEGIMTRNLYLGNTLVFSRDTRFNGRVARLEPPIQGRDAILEVRFDEILLDNGEKLPMAAHIRTDHPEHIWGGQVTRGTKPVLSTQRVWGIGEYNRVVFAGPRAMGNHIQFLPGEHWTLILEESLSIIQPRPPEF